MFSGDIERDRGMKWVNNHRYLKIETKQFICSVNQIN